MESKEKMSRVKTDPVRHLMASIHNLPLILGGKQTLTRGLAYCLLLLDMVAI
jgi:hypothetical protein